MKIVVIDAQGGGLGRAIITQIRQAFPTLTIIAVGTNAAASSAMIKAGASGCATGENAVIYNCRKCTGEDLIVGPIGILLTNAMYGEVSAAMASAVCECDAHKIVIPSNRCNVYVTGSTSMSIAAHISEIVAQIKTRVQPDSPLT